MQPKRIVVAGGGFGGVYTARKPEVSMTGAGMNENIRTDHFVLRKSIREIARERYLSRRTIRATAQHPH